MIKSLKPSEYNSELTIPSSKSYMQRAVAIATLSDTATTILNPDFSNDSRAGLGVAQALGCNVEEYPDRIVLTPNHHPAGNIVDVGEAGLGLRLYTPICSLFGNNITVAGHGTLLKRPVDEMIAPLSKLGVSITLTNNCAPVHTMGKLDGGNVDIDAGKSSQFLSGLLIALPKAERDSLLNITAINSKPYVSMTIDILKQFGCTIVNNDFNTIKISGNQHYNCSQYVVEGDWSSAAAHLAAGAIAGKVVVHGLQYNSLQADKAIIEVLENCGANVEVSSNSIVVTHNKLKAFRFDATDSPDLFPVLAALAANCDGISEIIGTSRLTHKESNRAKAISDEFAKLGIDVDITTKPNTMLVSGGKIRGGVLVSAHHDHRMAMALAVCALTADAPIDIDEAESVAKSYPTFWEQWKVN